MSAEVEIVIGKSVPGPGYIAHLRWWQGNLILHARGSTPEAARNRLLGLIVDLRVALDSLGVEVAGDAPRERAVTADLRLRGGGQ